ncbi:nuclear pore complex protein NUP50A-like [Dioscorea cayenensis subsp. rotundata]|uniref:Nuclear pore complex protein NUP50A-like n=1 Tax=Dioscorea cayennensis subsp. rotundata TaxID=55577 RepID=A0AB40CXP7_DIOCR|nr:nuclear pore complex protein NUP50A-like [Dioscorea cayenensis subsp. rotundata]XP_039143362.1 nuclear pore complex protein NUP50A-like [Dioscorea cayenensis subsp. rotundata]
MADAENAIPATKKRVAGRQISKDDPTLDDDDVPESEIGTFQRASDEVLATRRIVKVKRSQSSTGSSSNPFAGICLVNPTDAVAKTSSTDVQSQSAEVTPGDTGKSGDSEQIGNETSDKEATATEENGKKADDVTDTNVSVAEEKVKSNADDETEGDKTVENGGEYTDAKAKETTPGKEGKESSHEAAEESKKAVTVETEKEKPESNLEEKSGPAAHLSSFQQLSSSQNAFTGLAGTGFSSSSFSFGSNSKDGSTTFGGNSGSIFGVNSETSTFPSFGIGNSNNEKSSFQLFGSTGAGAAKSGTSGITSMPEVPIETGEENEKAVFTADAILYEYLDGGWKERGKGELKVNVSVSGLEKARLIMRARGNYRLILNASLYPDMSLTNMEKKGITFACINSAGEGKDGLSTFALKFKDASFVEEFRGIVAAHKGKKAETAILKTPENSPKASDD